MSESLAAKSLPAEAPPRRGRPPLPIPADAPALVEDLAADGWSIVGISWKLGIDKETLARWMRESGEMLEAFEVGRERERRTLHNKVYRTAMESSNEAVALRAAMFLLNCRHNYRDPSQDGGAQTNITINLPGAMTREEFLRSVISEQ
jgi:hypothetical protein